MSGLSQRLLYGVHSFTPYSRTTGLPYGTVKVLKSSSLSLAATLVELLGGASKFPWAVEDGPIASELNLKGNQYEDFMFTLFLGYTPTANSTEALGNCTTLTNKNGTSLKSATTGVATATVKAGSEGDLKFGKYVVVATDATHVDVYLLSDVDIARGTDGTIQSNSMKITASPLVITATVAITIPNFGIELTGGSGSIALVTGDTATFNVRPENSGNMLVNIGGSGTLFPEFGALVLGQKRGNQEMFEIDCYRCKGAGMPLNFDMNAFSEYDIKIKVIYDSVADGVFGVRAIQPSNT